MEQVPRPPGSRPWLKSAESFVTRLLPVYSTLTPETLSLYVQSLCKVQDWVEDRNRKVNTIKMKLQQLHFIKQNHSVSFLGLHANKSDPSRLSTCEWVSCINRRTDCETNPSDFGSSYRNCCTTATYYPESFIRAGARQIAAPILEFHFQNTLDLGNRREGSVSIPIKNDCMQFVLRYHLDAAHFSSMVETAGWTIANVLQNFFSMELTSLSACRLLTNRTTNQPTSIMGRESGSRFANLLENRDGRMSW